MTTATTVQMQTKLRFNPNCKITRRIDNVVAFWIFCCVAVAVVVTVETHRTKWKLSAFKKLMWNKWKTWTLNCFHSCEMWFDDKNAIKGIEEWSQAIFDIKFFHSIYYDSRHFLNIQFTHLSLFLSFRFCDAICLCSCNAIFTKWNVKQKYTNEPNFYGCEKNSCTKYFDNFFGLLSISHFFLRLSLSLFCSHSYSISFGWCFEKFCDVRFFFFANVSRATVVKTDFTFNK